MWLRRARTIRLLTTATSWSPAVPVSSADWIGGTRRRLGCSLLIAPRQRCWGSVHVVGNLTLVCGQRWRLLVRSPVGRSRKPPFPPPGTTPGPLRLPPGATPPLTPPSGPPSSGPPPGMPLRPPPGPPSAPPGTPPPLTLGPPNRALRTLCTGGSAPTLKAHPSRLSSPSTGRPRNDPLRSAERRQSPIPLPLLRVPIRRHRGFRRVD